MSSTKTPEPPGVKAAALRAEADALERESRAAARSVKEFSKIMIKTYSWACILWISASYILAAFGLTVNEGVTVAVISSLAAVLLAYFIKSCKENIKKNGG